MQVIGLPRQVIRPAVSASRLLGAKPPNRVAARRRDAAARWLRARRDGLSADQAARAVGVSRATLDRWAERAEPQSRRPVRVRVRNPHWTPALAKAVEHLRGDNPTWGKRKLAAVLCRESMAASISTVGRILRKLMDRGVVVPVPPCAATRPLAASVSPPSSATPGACPKGSSRHAPARSCRSTRCS